MNLISQPSSVLDDTRPSEQTALMRLLLLLLCCIFFGTALIHAEQSLRWAVTPAGANAAGLSAEQLNRDPDPIIRDAFGIAKGGIAVDEIVRLGYWLKPEGDLARAAAVASPVGR